MSASTTRVIPTHVRACVHSEFPDTRWFIWQWLRSAAAGSARRIPYSCGSWRCKVCQRFEAAVTFARIKEACEPLSDDGWCFFVLTLDREHFYDNKNAPTFESATEAYRAMGKMTARFLRNLGRVWGTQWRTEWRKRKDGTSYPREVRTMGNRWVSVVEKHKSGWPHVNLMVHCPNLAAHLRAERARRMEDPSTAEAVEYCRQAWRDKAWVPAEIRARARRASLMADDVLDCAERAGWGRESSAEAARNTEAVASYFVKLSGHHDRAVNEVAKLTQLPDNADARFRRLRSGRKFLPERRSNPEVTGCMVRREKQANGEWKILPVNPPKDPEQAAPTWAAIQAELALIREEREARNAGRKHEAPTVRRARNGKLEPARASPQVREVRDKLVRLMAASA